MYPIFANVKNQIVILGTHHHLQLSGGFTDSACYFLYFYYFLIYCVNCKPIGDFRKCLLVVFFFFLNFIV
jgi:hypothetical protein